MQAACIVHTRIQVAQQKMDEHAKYVLLLEAVPFSSYPDDRNFNFFRCRSGLRIINVCSAVTLYCCTAAAAADLIHRLLSGTLYP